MGKSNKLRHARRQQADRTVCAVLAAHSRRKSEPRSPSRYGDFAPRYRAKIEACRTFALRRPEDWRCRLKSRSEERRFLDLVRFTFAQYPRAAASRAGVDRATSTTISSTIVRPRVRRPDGAAPDLLRWYLVATQGGSLHKQHASLSVEARDPPFPRLRRTQLTAGRAFWYAVARAQSEMRRCAQGFADQAFRFLDRLLVLARRGALLRAQPDADRGDEQSGRFHPRGQGGGRGLRAQGAHSAGAAAADGGMAPRAAESSRQSAAAAGPARRSPTSSTGPGATTTPRSGASARSRPAMSVPRGSAHAPLRRVLQAACVSGDVSIWSVTCEYPLGHINKGVTIELRKDGAIVQCRGFANRLPHANEAAMVKHWAREHGIELAGAGAVAHHR